MNKNNISANYYNTDQTLFMKERCYEMKLNKKEVIKI